MQTRFKFLSLSLLHLSSSSLPYFPPSQNIIFILFYFIHSVTLISDLGPCHIFADEWQTLLLVSRSLLMLSLPPRRLLTFLLSPIFLQRQIYPTKHNRAELRIYSFIHLLIYCTHFAFTISIDWLEVNFHFLHQVRALSLCYIHSAHHSARHLVSKQLLSKRLIQPAH